MLQSSPKKLSPVFTPSILVIDDEPDNYDVIEALLHGEGYQLHYVQSGERAIACLEMFNPDVILLDVMMPDVDGIAVCQRIKAMRRWQMVPIIMVTALTAKEDIAEALSAGADDFISKPVNKLELRARVNSMLRIKRQQDGLQAMIHLRENTIKLLQRNLSELRGNVAHALPHEFNTPLNGILGLLSLLVEDYDDMDNEEIKEMLGLAQTSATRMERLIQSFMHYVQIELTLADSDRLKALRKGQYATDILPLAQSLLSTTADKAHRLSDLKLDVESACVSLADHDLFWVLQELFDNALKFSSPGTPIVVRGKMIDGQFYFSISSQSRGLTPDQIAQIGAFMQFERKQYEQQGSGLGLAIVKETMRMYGGSFSITSEIDQETSVHLTLPVAQASSQVINFN